MNPARLRLLALRDQNDAVGQDMAIERHRFDALRDAEAPRAVSAHQLFQTPEPIAARLVSLCGDLTGRRILEPSAGLGRIYRALRARTDAPVTLVELSPQCMAELYRQTAHDDAVTLVQGDFLGCDADRLGGLFDVVVMNPPFERGVDIRHLFHSVSLLRPGGVVVGLCYAGTKQRKAFEHADDWTWELLPPGSFRQEGTTADVALVTHRKAST